MAAPDDGMRILTARPNWLGFGEWKVLRDRLKVRGELRERKCLHGDGRQRAWPRDG